ncbi:MAG: hypothetical protein IT322_21230 [Anaerolineae bacterium]|nr:hypothetical protein [Anaerolineae bacterium]
MRKRIKGRAIKAVPITIRGDRQYVKALSEIAESKDMWLADLVREAVDKYCGKLIKSTTHV